MSDRATDAGGEIDGLAPVIPLFGSRGSEHEHERRSGRGSTDGRGEPRVADDPVDDPAEWHTTWQLEAPREIESPGLGETPDDHRLEDAERLLLRRLRGRSLSVAEARAVVTRFDLEPHEIDRMLEGFQHRGYLDDDALAEQLVHVGVDRRGQGRQVIGMTLASRGIPRDVADRALAAMPDDDAERALEFAVSKARAMRDLDRDTAIRRLTGQLARRGYDGSVAFTAARSALDADR